MNFCPDCSGPILRHIPDGEDRLRHVCSICGVIHYQNPKVIAGCLPTHEGRVLLCRRAIEPRYGCWTLPAGFMELGETIRDAAQREAFEEAGIEVADSDCYTLISLPGRSQVYVFYLAPMASPRFAPGIESLEVKWFNEAEIPWEELAFETVRRTLRHYFSDLKLGIFPFREEAIGSDP